MNPVKSFQQFFWFYFTILRVFPQVLFVSHSLSNEIDRSKRRKCPQNLQMRFQCGQPVTHPVFIFIIFSQFFKIDPLLFQCLSGKIAVRPVHHFQEIFPAPVPCRQFQICHQTSADPVMKQVRQLFLHGKRYLILHQRIDQTFCLLIGTQQDCRILQILPALQPPLQSRYDTHIFLSGILKLFACHRHPFFIRSRQLLLKTSGITSDHFHSRMQNIFTAPVIHIQQNCLRIRIVLCKIQHDLRSCSPEMVNRLVIIPHDKQIIRGSRQHPQDLIL